MAKKQENVPRYGTTMRRGIQYYRARITDADGKRVDLYAETCEELQLKEMEARRPGRGGGFPQKTSNGGRVLREVAAHAVGKGIFRHVERIYPDHEQLYCQAFRRYVS